MATGKSRVVGPEDLVRAVCGVAELFGADEVVIISSQALLVARDDIARDLRMSVEIDAYPVNNREWEARHPDSEASEIVNTWLGEGSNFHKSFGFFVDGVDEYTATLATDWRERAVTREVNVSGRMVRVVAPEAADLVAAKLARGLA